MLACVSQSQPGGWLANLGPPVWARVGADITLLREREVDYDQDRNTRKIAEVLVRKVPDDQQVRLEGSGVRPSPLTSDL